jgi:putative phosphoesterase
MIVGVVSDTHGNREGMLFLAQRLQAQGVATLLHLGDDYGDLAILAQAGLKVLGVPGVYCPEYRDPKIPNRQVVELGGLKFLLTHTGERHRYDAMGDPDPETAAFEVHAVLYGHSHAPTLEERQGTAWINPGHLRDRMDRGHPPTFALLKIALPELSVQIHRLADGELLLARTFIFPA